MNLIRLCLSRPVGVSVGVILVLLFGGLALTVLPVQLTPNVDTPVVTVQTRWTGANPQEVERDIVIRQEEQLRSVKGLRKMTSASRDGEGVITLEFYNDVERAEALRDVNDKMRQVTNYPPEVDEPTIAASDTASSSEIAWLILHATDGHDEKLPEMYDFAKDFVQPYLDRVKGVASTDIYGGREREIQVRLDSGKLAVRGLSFAQVEQALRGQNANTSAGRSTQGKRDVAVRTVGQYESPDEIRNTVIAYTAGGPVYVRDVAEVERGFKKQYSFVRSRGEYSLAFPVRREVGANVVEVMRGVRAAVNTVNEQVLKGRNLALELKQVYDETVYVDQAIGMVKESALTGSVLTVIVLIVFLRNWRATAVVTLAIPISVIGTFVLMVALGRTLNVISLAGIAFAIGMVVDDSIVVLENIFRHREMGKGVLQACYDAATEVWAPVLASTLTTMAVFVPVIFIREEAGQLFRDISLATAGAVAISLPVAVLVVPVLAHTLMTIGRRKSAVVHELHKEPEQVRAAGLAARLVDWLNHRRGVRAAVIAGMTLGSIALTPFLIPDATYLPSGNKNLVFGFLLTPPGYSTDEFKRMGGPIESVIRSYWEAKPGSAEAKALDDRWRQQVEGMITANAIPELAGFPAGSLNPFRRLERDRILREWRTPPPLIEDFFYVAFNGNAFMGCTSRDPARVKPLVRLLQTTGGAIPGTFPFFFQDQLFRFGGGNTAEIQIRGDDLDHVTAAAQAVMGACMGAGYGYPQPDPSNFNLGRPELRIVPDRERAADLGISARDVGFIVQACVDGAFVGDYRESGARTIDISLYVNGQSDRSTQEIGQVPIYTPAGQIVPLSAAVKLVDTTALEQINHIERQRSVTLTVNPPETKPLATVIAEVTSQIVPGLRKSGQISDDVVVSLTGNADKLGVARATMVGEWKGFTLASVINIVGSRFFLSVLICFLLLVALYESWVYPFVIMFSVPLALFGGFLGLWFCHLGTLLTSNQAVQQLDVLTFLGFIILVGTVVKNAILLVDQSLQNMRLHGLELHTAVREAVRARVRPVLMTSFTTIFGQIPLAVIPGAGSELYRGLAAVCVGGMLISTFGTLVLVPAVLSTVLEIRRYFAGDELIEVAAGAEA